jgi:hypothetical protein
MPDLHAKDDLAIPGVDEKLRKAFDAGDVKGLDRREADGLTVAAGFGLVTQTGGFGDFGVSRSASLYSLLGPLLP